MTVSEESSQFPFSEWQARIVFILLVVCGVLITMLSCCKPTFVTFLSTKGLIHGFLTILSLGVIAFSLSDNVADFFRNYGLAIFLFGPIVVHISYYQSPLLYMASLLTINAWAVISYSPSKNSVDWDYILVALYILWVVTGIIISAGRFGYIPYHAELADVQGLREFKYYQALYDSPRLSFLLDLRYVLSIALALTLVGTAFYQAFRAKLIKLPRIPAFVPDQITKKSDSILEVILHPFFVVFAALFRVVLAVVDAIWYMIAVVGFYIYQFSSKLALRVYIFLTSASVWKAIGKVLASYIIVLLFSYFGESLSSDIYAYMNRFYILREMIGQLDISLFFVAVFFLAALIAFSAYRAIWKDLSEWKIALERCAMAGATIILAFTISGYLVHGISLSGIVAINGFGQVGPFLFVISMIIFIFGIYALWRWFITSTSHK